MSLKKSVRLQISGAYIILLIASHVVEDTRAEPARSPGIRTASIRAVDHDQLQSGAILLAYRDTAPESTGIPVVLVHGSPGSGEALEKLAGLLAPRFRVIVPDLPGFGVSAHDLPDYSFRAHGEYLIELLDALHIDRAQFVGFSMGGGVALSIADLAPRRVASIVMLSAIGVQEHELTGSYRVNHFLHGAQLALLWTLKNGFPHFALFRNVSLTVEYARNFYDSDQRPLRTILAQYRGPMLIIHGIRDQNVPIAAALEHHRLVPQSEIVELDENHFIAFMRPSAFIDPLERFLAGAR
jgi:pimeloyl-ACP methyl ester carboxylesterase